MASSVSHPTSLPSSLSTALSLPRPPRPIHPLSARGKWVRDPIPPVLRPLVRAYLLGYASAVAPRLLTLLLQHISRRRPRRRNSTAAEPSTPDGEASTTHKQLRSQPTRESFLAGLQRILSAGLEWQRFPTFCAVLVGGSTLLEVPLKRLFDRLAATLSEAARKRCVNPCFS